MERSIDNFIFQSHKIIGNKLLLTLDGGFCCVRIDQITSWQIELSDANSYDLVLILKSGSTDVIVTLVRPEKMPQLIDVIQRLIQGQEEILELMPNAVRDRLTQES